MRRGILGLWPRCVERDRGYPDHGVRPRRAAGRRFALPDGELDYLSDLRNEASVWEDVVRIEARCPNDIGKPYLLGWTSDGSILAAGLDLTPLL